LFLSWGPGIRAISQIISAETLGSDMANCSDCLVGRRHYDRTRRGWKLECYGIGFFNVNFEYEVWVRLVASLPIAGPAHWSDMPAWRLGRLLVLFALSAVMTLLTPRSAERRRQQPVAEFQSPKPQRRETVTEHQLNLVHQSTPKCHPRAITSSELDLP
jgi:hypothetical protein